MPERVHAPFAESTVPIAVPSTYTVTVPDPPVPDTDVTPASSGPVTVGAVGAVAAARTVTEFEALLIVLPSAVTFAVNTSLVANVNPVIDQLPKLLTVVVPNTVLPALYKVMVEPDCSTDVPDTVLAEPE